MSGLKKEVWVKQLMEKFYPETSFLNYARDFSGLVENDIIKITENGKKTDAKGGLCGGRKIC